MPPRSYAIRASLNLEANRAFLHDAGVVSRSISLDCRAPIAYCTLDDAIAASRATFDLILEPGPCEPISIDATVLVVWVDSLLPTADLTLASSLD